MTAAGQRADKISTVEVARAHQALDDEEQIAWIHVGKQRPEAVALGNHTPDELLPVHASHA